jgi:lipid-binding SYLF domain-containing protein
MSVRSPNRLFLFSFSLLLMFTLCWTQSVGTAQAASKAVTSAQVHDTLQFFKEHVKGADTVLSQAKGILVFPDVVQGGLFAIGGEYGIGALVVHDYVKDYYRIASGSIGPQLGAQKKSFIIVFLTPQALDDFRHSSGWQVGVDALVTVVVVGAEGAITNEQLANKPVVAFVLDQKGLMYDLSLEGLRIFRAKNLH